MGGGARTRDEDFLRGAEAGWNFLSSARKAGKVTERGTESFEFKWAFTVSKKVKSRDGGDSSAQLSLEPGFGTRFGMIFKNCLHLVQAFERTNGSE